MWGWGFAARFEVTHRSRNAHRSMHEVAVISVKDGSLSRSVHTHKHAHRGNRLARDEAPWSGEVMQTGGDACSEPVRRSRGILRWLEARNAF